jgi:SAM-dependent methyltransferase
MRSWCRHVRHRLLARLDEACERAVAERKRSLLGRLHGDVLEIGPGGYPSFGYFSGAIRWCGVEPNLDHHSSILAAAARVGIPAEIVRSSGGALPFADSSFDVVVSLFALCTVPDPPVMLSEIRRVLRPDGVFVFMEHVAASDFPARMLQKAVRPIWIRFAEGCRPDCETGSAIAAAGFTDVQFESFRIAVPIIHPHLSGIARK